MTERFVQMGIDELSVSPTFVLPVRKDRKRNGIKALRAGFFLCIN